jgi:hypothetical protein
MWAVHLLAIIFVCIPHGPLQEGLFSLDYGSHAYMVLRDMSYTGVTVATRDARVRLSACLQDLWALYKVLFCNRFKTGNGAGVQHLELRCPRSPSEEC